MSGLIVVLGLFLFIGLSAFGFMPTVRHRLCKEKLGRTCDGHRHFMIGVFQIGFAPFLTLGLTYVFWQGWSSLVNFVAT